MASIGHENIKNNQKPLSLTKLSSKIFAIMQTQQKTTFSEVADIILNENREQVTEERTLRRRVYDVLNVLCAANMITKDEKKIYFHPPEMLGKSIAYTDAYKQTQDRVAMKQSELIEKVRQLLFFKLLINRNKNNQRGNLTIQLPTILMGFSNVSNGSISKSLDGKSLVVSSTSPPQFFSPLNVYEAIGFSPEEKSAVIRSIKPLASLEYILVPVREANICNNATIHTNLQDYEKEESSLYMENSFGTLIL